MKSHHCIVALLNKIPFLFLIVDYHFDLRLAGIGFFEAAGFEFVVKVG
jgi:hypothetical protein